MKQFVGISRDRSVSMRGVAPAALKDYNSLVDSFKENSIRFGVDTTVSVIDCGIRKSSYGPTSNSFSEQFVNTRNLSRMYDYPVSGNATPLYDSVSDLINHFKSLHSSVQKDPEVSFLVLVVTDGEDNASSMTARKLADEIRVLESTDKWTFVFRVPKGYKRILIADGFNAGNILEFDAGNEREYERTTAVTQAAVSSFYEGRTKGLRSTGTFYASTDGLDTKVVKQELVNISKDVKVIRVAQEWDGHQISEFVREKDGSYVLGTVHYQLTKREEVQDHKRLIVWDKESGYYYTGREARNLIGMPEHGTIKVAPGSFPKFELFVQSSSVNRKLVGGTKVVIYKK